MIRAQCSTIASDGLAYRTLGEGPLALCGRWAGRVSIFKWFYFNSSWTSDCTHWHNKSLNWL